MTLVNGKCVECEPGFTTGLVALCVPCAANRFKAAGQGTRRFCADADPDVEPVTECVKGYRRKRQILGE